MMWENRRGSAIMTTMFLLSGMVIVAIISIGLITNALARRRAEGASVKSFYAAETSAERAMSLMKNDTNGAFFTACAQNTGVVMYVDFSAKTCIASPAYANLDNNPLFPKYSASITRVGSGLNRDIEVRGRGLFQGTARQVLVKYCPASCYGKTPGSDDGCGGLCK